MGATGHTHLITAFGFDHTAEVLATDQGPLPDDLFVLATGSSAGSLPVPGADDPLILRTGRATDAERLLSAISDGGDVLPSADTVSFEGTIDSDDMAPPVGKARPLRSAARHAPGVHLGSGVDREQCVRRREGGSFEAFYERTKDRYLRAFLAIHPDAAEADDVVAEAFTRSNRRTLGQDVRRPSLPVVQHPGDLG
ncbi:MAG: hypothetical protein QM733_24000 [Ilumatobacteraceae bacterium]